MEKKDLYAIAQAIVKYIEITEPTPNSDFILPSMSGVKRTNPFADGKRPAVLTIERNDLFENNK